MFKVAIVLPGKLRGYQQVVNGLQSLYSYCSPRECVLDEFLLPRASGETFFKMQANRIVHQLAVGRYDLVMTIGASCSVGIKDALFLKKIEMPLVFVGVDDPVDLGLLSNQGSAEKDIAGISMMTPCSVIPVETIIRLYGLSRPVVIVYRESNFVGRARSTILEISEYLKERGAIYKMLTIPDGELESGFISSSLSESDVAVIPMRGVYADDVATIAEGCVSAKADLFSGSDGIMSNTAIFGYKSDIRYMGDQAACIAKQFLVDEVPLSKIGHQRIEDVSQLVINNNKLLSHGVIAKDDNFVIAFDSGKEFRYTLQLFYHYVMSMGHVLETRIFEHLLGRQREAGKGILCEPIKINGSRDDREYNKEQAAYVIKDAAPFATAWGHEAACRLQNQMILQGRYKPMLIVKFSDDDQGTEPALMHKGNSWPKEAPIIRIILPALPVTKIIDIITALHPTKKRIGYVHSFGPYTASPLHVKRYHTLREYCAEKGLELVHSGSAQGGKAFADVCREVAKKVDAIFCLPDEVDAGDAKVMAQIAHAENVFIIGGDYERFGWMSGVLGVDYESAFDKIFADMAIAARGLEKPESMTIAPKESECYYFHLNRKWLLNHNYPIPTHLESLLQLAVIIDPPEKDGDDLDGEATMLDMLAPFKSVIRTAPTEGEIGEEGGESMLALFKRRIMAKMMG